VRVTGAERPPWYDRNPIRRQLSYVGSAIAPHGLTSRASYTVPTGKRAYIQSMECALACSETVTQFGRTRCMIYVESNPVLGIYQSLERLLYESHEAVGESGEIQAGETIQIYTYDSDGDGNYDYMGMIHMIEFNA